MILGDVTVPVTRDRTGGDGPSDRDSVTRTPGAGPGHGHWPALGPVHHDRGTGGPAARALRLAALRVHVPATCDSARPPGPLALTASEGTVPKARRLPGRPGPVAAGESESGVALAGLGRRSLSHSVPGRLQPEPLRLRRRPTSHGLSLQ